MTEKSEKEAIEDFENGGVPRPRDVAGDPSEPRSEKDRSYGLLKDDEAEVDPVGQAPEEFEKDLDIEYDGILAEVDEFMEENGNELIVAEDIGQGGVRFAYDILEDGGFEKIHITVNPRGEIVSLTYTGPSEDEDSEYGVTVPLVQNPLNRLDDPIYGDGGISLRDFLAGEHEERFNQLPQDHQVPDYPDPADRPERRKDDRDNSRYH